VRAVTAAAAAADVCDILIASNAAVAGRAMNRAKQLAAGVIGGWLLGSTLTLGAPSPQVPESLKVPAGEQLILTGHAKGVQIYTCQAGATEGPPAWTLKAPEAEIRDDQGKVILHHFAGPTWKHQDGSEVTGKAVARADAPDGAGVPWLLLAATGHAGTGVLSAVTSVQRLHTHGGQPPATGCDAARVGSETRSPYTADYYFYAPSH
jgi:hypothetical protein